MEIRQLRYFVAVAETGSISRAAQSIFLTQPTLSRQIKALEDTIGRALFVRHAHSVELTPAGEVLLQEARHLISQTDMALERVRGYGHRLQLRVGYAPSLASGLLSTAMHKFIQMHADVRVELFDLSSKEMLLGLQNGTLDLALTVNPERDTRGLIWTQLAQVTWQVAVSHHHPLAQLSVMSPAEAAREPLLVFCQRDYPEYWDFITSWFREKGERPVISGEYDGVNSLLSAVESRLGIALVTTGSTELVPKRVRLIPLTHAPRTISIAAGYREGRETEKAVAVFITELRNAAALYQ